MLFYSYLTSNKQLLSEKQTEKVINSLQFRKKHLFLQSQTQKEKNNNAKYKKQ